MQIQGKAKELFTAFSKINCRAYAETCLLANHVLAKSPSYNDVLAKYQRGEQPGVITPWALFIKLIKYYCINFAALFLFITAALLRYQVKLAALPALDEYKKNKKPIRIIDVFFVIHRIVKENSYAGNFLPDLEKELVAKGYAPIFLARIYGTRNPKLLKKAFEILKNLTTPVLTEMELLKKEDYWQLIKHIFVFPYFTLHLVKFLDQYGPEGHIRSALLACLDECYLTGELRRIAGARLKELVPEDAAIISWYENQVIDKCFIHGLHFGLSGFATVKKQLKTFDRQEIANKVNAVRQDKIKCYAAQLLIWPPELLNNSFDLTDAVYALCPDVTVVNGSFFLPEISAEDLDIYKGLIPKYRIGPALRYADVFTQDAVIIQSDNPILVLLSYHPTEVVRVLTLLAKIQDQLIQKKVNLIYRFHPSTKVEDFSEYLPPNPVLSKEKFSLALKNCSMVLGSGSGALAEAAACGVPTITVQALDNTGLNYLPLFAKGELWEEIVNSEDLFIAGDKLNLFLIKPERPEVIKKFRAMLFTESSNVLIARAFDL